jgi:GDP-4-dehydro-6-deoxy-D-mannose reductase
VRIEKDGRGVVLAVEECERLKAIKTGRAVDQAELRADLAPDTVYNIASGMPRRIGDILDGLLSFSAIKPKIEMERDACGPPMSPAWRVMRRARRDFDWTQAIPWEDTLLAVLEDGRARAKTPP